jgi:hypothetical protein
LETRILPTPVAEANRNILFVAGKKAGFHHPALPLQQYGKQVNIETLFQDPGKVDLNDAVVLTDDKSILKLLNIYGGNSWRRDAAI